MKRPLIVSLALSLLVPAVAFAGTCANPTPLSPRTDPGSLSGTTCGGEAGIPLGGAVAPHPAQIYSFVYNNNASGALTVTGAEREVIVAASCTTLPLGGFAPGVNADVGGMGLTNGQTYLLIVGTDSGLPTTQPPRCGTFDMNWVALPVSLQNFSVD